MGHNTKGMVDGKECYGILERVFPAGEEGLRQVPEACFECTDRVSCLKEAIRTREGIEMRTRLLERAEEGGMLSKIRRWSHKKHLSRQIREGKKK